MIALRIGRTLEELPVVIAPGSVRPRDNGRHPGGRPPALDQATADTILEYLRLGEYLEIAVAAAGVSDVTFRAWKRRGAEELEAGEVDGPFAKFLLAAKQRSALAQIDALRDIRGKVENWPASAWFKERTSSRWRRRLAIAELEDAHEEDDGGLEVRVRVVDSRAAALDVEGSSRITEPA